MPKFDVGRVTITTAGRTARYTDQKDEKSPPIDGKATLAELETPDGFKGTLGVVEWPNGTSEITLVDFAEGPDVYRRMESAGRTQVLTDNGHWMLVIRALKWGDKNRATLHNVTFDELDKLIKDDSKAVLEAFPGVALGRYGDMQPNTSAQFREAIGMKVPTGEMDALAAMYAMTRVMPLMVGFGLNTVIGMD
jgi:hypothetical protein